MKILLILIIVILLSFVNMFAQNPQWIVYDPHEAGGGYVLWFSSIAIDVDNVKWLGTLQYYGYGGYGSEGLLLFDDIEWFIYDPVNSGLPSYEVSSVTLDQANNKWIGTTAGLAIFDNFNWTVYDTSNSGLPGNQMSCIALDNSDNKWIGIGWVSFENGMAFYYEKGLAKFDDSNWTVYDTSNSDIPSDGIRCIAIDDSDNKWIGTTAGLVKFDNINWTVYDTSNSILPDNDIRCIAVDEFANKWIGTYRGLAKFDDTNWTVYDSSNSVLALEEIQCIVLDDSGNKWIGTDDLVKFDDTNWTVFDSSNSGLPYAGVNRIAIDDFGNKWIGTPPALSVFNENGVILSNNTVDSKTMPTDFLIYQNFPNPFNPSTTIEFTIPKTEFVTLKIYNLLGQEVITLVSEKLKVGKYQYTWNASSLTTGVYLYQLRAGENVETQKMILMK